MNDRDPAQFSSKPALEHSDRPSKSQRKRDMHARQDLGRKLVELGTSQLARLALPEVLHDAIRAAERLNTHEARRRQLQYIGKLMRSADYPAILAAYEDLGAASQAAVGLMHRCERLRDALLDDDAALVVYIEQNAGVDVQWLRSKVRAARQQRGTAAAPRHARELYRWLHARLQAQSRVAAHEPR